MKRNFVANKAGYFFTAVTIIVVLFVADIVYVVAALVNNKFFDAFAGYSAADIQIAGLQSTLRYVGPITIVTLNIGLIILLIVAAWKRQSVESEGELSL